MDKGYAILLALMAVYLVGGGVLYLRARKWEPEDKAKS